MLKNINEIINDLSKNASMCDGYEEYYKFLFQEHFDKYCGEHSKGDADSPAGVIDRNGGADFDLCYQEAVWFCAANYFRILESRVVGYVLGTEKMHDFFREMKFVEMDCSKGPINYILDKFGLKLSASQHKLFAETLKREAQFHWKELEKWLNRKGAGYTGGKPGMEKLFKENIEYMTESPHFCGNEGVPGSVSLSL